MSERGFSEDNDPRRDFMATYFDHDDDVTRGMVGDYLDRIEVAAVQTDRERMARAVERGEWDDVFVESFNALRSEMYLPAHLHNDHPCVGCDLLRRLTGKTLGPPDGLPTISGQRVSLPHSSRLPSSPERTPERTAAGPEDSTGSGLCDASLSDGWTCTRLPNHEGVHQ